MISASIFLAQLIGIAALVMGSSMIVRRKMLMSIFHELSDNRALSYVMGVLIFLMGLLLVLNHNIWGGSWQVVITIIGWFILVEGLAYLFITTDRLKEYLALINDRKIYYFIAAVYIAIGLYLFYYGFVAPR